MRRTRSRRAAAGAASIAILIAGASVGIAGAPLPATEGGDLGAGPFATMHMLLQKTVLNVNVATIDVRFDKGTQGRFTQIATGKAMFHKHMEMDLAQAYAYATEFMAGAIQSEDAKAGIDAFANKKPKPEWKGR